MSSMILFYSPRDAHGYYSNFSRHRVDIYNRTWKTSEHAFQAMKYHPHAMNLVDKVHQADTPGQAAHLGRDRSFPLRSDWDQKPPNIPDIDQPEDGIDRRGISAEPLFARTKDVIMYEVCLAKFRQNRNIRELLLETLDEPLVEDAPHDPYWGWGSSHVGENKLGRILMAVRDQLSV